MDTINNGGQFVQSYIVGPFLAIKPNHDESDNCDCWRVFGITPTSNEDVLSMTLLADCPTTAEMLSTIEQMYGMAQRVQSLHDQLLSKLDQYQMSRSVQQDIDAL